MNLKDTGKKFGKHVARSVFLPRFVTTPKDVFITLGRVSAQMSQFGIQSAKAKGQRSNINYIQSPDGASAFKAVAEANDWTQDGLAAQLRSVRFVKLACLALAWLSLMGMVSVALFLPIGYAYMLLLCGLWLGFLCFGIQVFKMTLFQVQLQEQRLFGLKELVGRSDFFSKLLL